MMFQPIKMDVAAVSKECSQLWKSMSPDQKQHWDQLSEMDKRGYNEQKAAYQGPWRIATKKVKKKVRCTHDVLQDCVNIWVISNSCDICCMHHSSHRKLAFLNELRRHFSYL